MYSQKVTRVSNKECTLFEDSKRRRKKKGVESRLGGDILYSMGGVGWKSHIG